MGYIKKGFQLAIGVCLGKALYKSINTVAADIVCKYVPEKYWNRERPEYLDFGLSANKTSEKKQHPIGFKGD